MMKHANWNFVTGFALLGVVAASHGQDKFRQLDELWPTPTSYRTASGAPGHDYWQQKADYEIDVALDEKTHEISGSERITYHNNSPDTLPYLWIQLDQNNFDPQSTRRLTQTNRIGRRSPAITDGEVTFDTLGTLLKQQEFRGGYRIEAVTDDAGDPLRHVIRGTMMRVELPEPVDPGDKTVIRIAWSYPIVEQRFYYARAGREYFEDDGNWLYEIAQWYPRLAVYSDVAGWQNKEFIVSEFALEFGDFVVNITVPDDHVVAATGELLNPKEVLTQTQQNRLKQARSASSPVYIITPDEARENESSTPAGTKTWRFKADMVRDFAWASSRKFIWDAQGHELDGEFTMAMSFWPKEGEPLWSQYSTHSVMQALDVYGRMAFPMPYPVMISVNGPVGGMEYPMMTFNGMRPEEDGTYGKRQKYGLISVIIHEVGHSWFPMIVNSDERQWTWMDEGINTFVQFIAEQEWEEDYPSRRGEPRNIVNYAKNPNKVPIMTEGDSLLQLGNNAYAKPATALNILRETVLGREVFDAAFKEYSNRWKFKKPEPADLFRTLEDASGRDLDWFWRGWFYTTDHTDIAVERLTRYVMDSGDPAIDKARDREEEENKPRTISQQRYAESEKRVDKHPELFDFYNEFDEFDVTEEDKEKFVEFLDGLSEEEKALLENKYHFYMADFENVGGLVMPVILKVNYMDGTEEIIRYPAEIWRYDNQKVAKLLITEKEVESLEVDPFEETGDVDRFNNHFPRQIEEKRFEVKKDKEDEKNPMQKARDREKLLEGTEPETPEEN